MIRTTVGILPDKMVGLIAFLSMVEKPYRNKVFAMADRLKITKPWQFRRFSYSKLMASGKAGQKTMINLRMALVRCGCPYYPDDTMAQLEKMLKSARNTIESRSVRLRFKVLDRDKFTCRYCGRSPMNDDSVVLEIDHVVPLSKGGTWNERNLITSCRDCNLGKSDAILCRK